MILQALYDYYQRKAADPDSNIAPQGYEQKEIPFIIILDAEGGFVNLEDTSEGLGKSKRYGRFLVVKGKSRSGSKSSDVANILWDHYGYVLAHPKDATEKAIADAQKQHATFVKDTQGIVERFPANAEFKAILSFLNSDEQKAKVLEHPSWKDCAKRLGCNLSFKIVGNRYLASEHPDLSVFAIKEALGEETEEENMEEQGVCLITGETSSIATLHTGTSIPGGKAGAKLVGFQKNSGYDSYNKQQGANAPVSKKAEDAYTTALNVLLSKESSSKFRIGETVVVFWAQKQVAFENQFSFFFSSPDKDNPDRNYQEIKSLYSSVHSGKINDDGDTPFFVLGLAPNAARISVRFWKAGTVREFAHHITTHFDDLAMVKGQKEEREYLTLFNLLANMAFEYKVDNLPPSLGSAMIASAMNGTCYPATIQQQCLRRIRADQKISYPRAAMLKAYLNRKNRLQTINERDITMALDTENTNQGYLCGRLFAVLEKIQEDALPGLNATIKDRFYGAASSTPVTVFGRLIKLSTHHQEKLGVGRKIYYERQLQAIIGNIGSNGMPAHLSLDDQSRFAIGYYHQRQDLFTSKVAPEKE